MRVEGARTHAHTHTHTQHSNVLYNGPHASGLILKQYLNFIPSGCSYEYNMMTCYVSPLSPRHGASSCSSRRRCLSQVNKISWNVLNNMSRTDNKEIGNSKISCYEMPQNVSDLSTVFRTTY
jgi:hypothetical protein